MGKNTMMRKTIRGQISRNSNLEKLLPHVYENIGFVFTKEDLSSIREKLMENKVKINHLGVPGFFIGFRFSRSLLLLVLVLLLQSMLLFQLK